MDAHSGWVDIFVIWAFIDSFTCMIIDGVWNLSGNLKHKDLMGQVVSSQAYVDDVQNDEITDDPADAVVEDQLDQHL